ncbi:hypothetical protein ACE4Z6_27880, partial [Salmonella enterica]|uniref:hypothetical protein n=1 Tax=Salmonella enterica TaxID=28901 RepID=UPI003D274211
DLLEDFALAEEIASEEREIYGGHTAVELDPSYQIPHDRDWIISLILQDKLMNFGPVFSGTYTKSEDLFSQARRIEWDRNQG